MLLDVWLRAGKLRSRHDQLALRHPARCDQSSLSECCSFGIRLVWSLRQATQRELDCERRAFVDLAFDRDCSSVRVDDLATDVKTQAEAAEFACRSGALETREDPGLVLGSNADSSVAHDKSCLVAARFDDH